MFDLELSRAILAAKKAGDVIKEVYSHPFKIWHKSKEQPVTEADRGADKIIQSTLLSAFPDDGWLSEESADTSERLHKKRVWIVDPLDGTKEFIAKIPEFAVSIGLSVNGSAVVGVIYNPISGELLSGSKGGGAFLLDKQVFVSNEENLNKARILSSRSETARGEWKNFEGRFIIQESGGLACKMLGIATGQAEGSFTLKPKSEWDFCAGTLIIQEARGRATHLDGSPLTFNNMKPRVPGLVYGNQAIHTQLLQFLKDEC